jgi:hypothetical protein
MQTEVAQWIAHAWSKMTRETIMNTWNGAGHNTGDHEDNEDSGSISAVVSVESNSWPPINKMKRKFQRMMRQGANLFLKSHNPPSLAQI